MIPCGDMHQSFTDTLKNGFSTTSPCLPIVSMFFLFTALPVDQVQAFCIQVPHIARWFPATARPSLFFSSDQNVQTFAVDGT